MRERLRLQVIVIRCAQKCAERSYSTLNSQHYRQLMHFRIYKNLFRNGYDWQFILIEKRRPLRGKATRVRSR